MNRKSKSRSERTAERVRKADERFAEELAVATQIVAKMDSGAAGYVEAKRRLALLQKQYLENHSQGYVRAEELRRLDRLGKAPAADGAAAKAEAILKEDPSIGYEALRGSFSREEQAAYLDSVRGHAA